MAEIILSIIGGLALFLYAVTSLSSSIKEIAGDGTRKWILRLTKNVFTAILSGALITAIMGSSSALIIITIVLINSQLLTFRQALGVIMGANIGTTVSSQIIALDFGQYSPVFMAIGLFLMMIPSNKTVTSSGRAILLFGMLFFGLFTIERAVEPLRDEVFFQNWMNALDNPVQGVGIGALVTLIIQSSSATVGMSIVFAKKGLLSMAGGLAVMMGAELGTCSDTLLATIRGSRQAIKAGIFHLVFNIASVITGLILFQPFFRVVEWVSGDASMERAVANGHMLFNISGVLIFVWFVPLFEKGLNALLPEKTENVK